MILVDTSVWIDFLSGRISAHRSALRALIEDGEDIAIAGIILTEILQGIRNERELRLTRAYLLQFPLIEPSSVFTYLRAADIYRACRRRGLTLRGTVDCIIAALCLQHDAVLLHNDVDFDRIAASTDLRVMQV